MNYFKAWEYFLLRPKNRWDERLKSKHTLAVSDLQSHVRGMLESIKRHSIRKPGLFIDQLWNVCKDLRGDDRDDLLVQSALEMMIAGTDTSSVTAYYALLGLAQDKALQSDLRQELRTATYNPQKSKLMHSVVDETLRFKPVGPVVLREAVDDDPNFQLNFPGEFAYSFVVYRLSFILSEWMNATNSIL